MGISLQDEKGNTITNAIQKILNESNYKPNKIWVDKGSQFYNNQWNHFCKIMHSKGILIAERFIKILKNKIYKYMTSLSKNVYIDKKLDGIVNKYNNTYQSTMKMKSVDIKLSTCIDSNKENNEKGP